jgi:hypothetical protein
VTPRCDTTHHPGCACHEARGAAQLAAATAERDDALAVVETRNAELDLAQARVAELEADLARAERDAMMVSSLRQSVADAEARTAHEAAKHRAWEARWYELVHALIEQQGGSLVVYEMTPNERASHLGRSIVEQPLPVSRATRYSLAPAEAGVFVASEEIAVGDAVVVTPDGTVAPATPKKDSDR